MKDNQMIEFLTALQSNNSLDWMHAHKDEQKQAALQFKQLVQTIITELSTEDISIAQVDANDISTRQ